MKPFSISPVSSSLSDTYETASNLIKAILCCAFLECAIQAALANGVSPTSENVITFLNNGFPPSGEMTVAKTILNSIPYPSSWNTKPTGPSNDKYHVVWDGTNNFVLEELTPQIVSRTNAVSGMLIGQKDGLRWNAAGYQLNILFQTNNAFDPAIDNNSTYDLVSFGKSMAHSLLCGFNFKDMVWNGNHLSAKVDDTAIEANLISSDNIQQIEGAIIVRNGENIQFRIDYLEWAKSDKSIYPKKYNIYMKYLGDHELKKQFAVEIIDFQESFKSDASAVFDPDGYIDRTFFKSYSYISNRNYFLSANGFLAVRNIPYPPMPESKPPKIFIRLIWILTLVFIPLVLWFKTRFVKNNNTQ